MTEALIIVIEILGMACFGHMVVDFTQSLDIPILNKKPFSCDMCMTFWLSLGFYIAEFGAFGVPLASISAILADLIFRLKERL